MGYDSLVALCQTRVNRWKVFLPSLQLEIPVMSWTTEKRLVSLLVSTSAFACLPV